MPEITDSNNGGGSGPLRKLIIAVAGVAVLLVVAYFIVSSQAFLKSVVLPRVGKAVNAEITVDKASLSPFSQVTLEKLRVQPTGQEPLLTAERVHVRYSLWSILRGNYVVHEAALAAPIIQMVKGPDGRSNLDRVMEGGTAKRPSGSVEPVRLAIRKVSIQDGVVRSVDRSQEGTARTVELGALNVTLDRLENGQAGNITIAGNLKLENRPEAAQTATNDVAEGKLTGSFAFQLDPKLLPQTLSGNANVAFSRTEGAYADFAGLAGTVQADVTPTDIRQLSLRFERGGQRLGQVQASGPMDLAKSEARLKIEVQSIDRHVLNLFGATRGWDFGQSTINATNFVTVVQQGEVLGAEGKIVGTRMTLAQKGGATPELDMDLDYKVRVNLDEQNALIERLTMSGKQQQKEILQASLDRPMTLTWAPAARGFAESTFRLGLSDVNLSDWKALIGTNAPSGLASLQVTVTARPDARELAAAGSGRVDSFAAQLGTNRVEQAAVGLSFNAVVKDFEKISLHQYRLEARQRDAPLLLSTGSGHYDLARQGLSLEASAEIALPALLRQFPSPLLTASSGLVRASSAVRKRDSKYTLTGNLSLGDFNGTIADYAFTNLQSVFDYNADLERPSLQVHSATLSLRTGYTPSGSVSVNGNYNLDNGTARLDFKVTDVNQAVLGPVLAPSLAEKRLVSISLGGAGSTIYDPNGATTLTASLQVTNWVVAAVRDQSALPKLSGNVELDTTLRDQVLDLRQFFLKLSPTAQAGNELHAKGRLDMKKTNSTPSQITIESEALDLTPYYEMFAGQDPPAAPAPLQPASAPGRQPASPAVAPAAEPEPADLPFEQLTASLGIKRLFIDKVAITNLNVGVKINRGEVTVKPLTLQVNGGPVEGTAVLNLGVPGYTYDLSFAANRVPIEPLSDTFTTNASGVYTGDLIAQAQLKGAGITGPSLQKHLTGKASLNLTNMHYEIVGRKTKRLLDPVALVLRVPELTQTPINWIAAQLEIGNGQIELEQFKVQSQAFYAESSGVIPMAAVLTNSPLDLPVALSLKRTLAEKANLLAANTPTNAAYAPLPRFVKVTGTIGEPSPEINKVVIAGLLAKSIGGIAPVGDKASTILQNLGGVLSGQRGAPASTNSPPGTNASPAAGIVEGIGGLLNQSSRDAARTNAPAATNKPARPNPLQDLLQLLPEKR